MDIIVRNFFRLLRAGVFNCQEQVEPMAAWKWKQVFRLSMIHGVENEAFEGYKHLSLQFNMHLPDDLLEEWKKQVSVSENSPQSHLQRLNKRMTKRLKAIEEQVGDKSATFRTLNASLSLACCLLTADRWVSELIRLCQLIQNEKQWIDRQQLQSWLSEMSMNRMIELEAALAVSLMGVDEADLPFVVDISQEKVAQYVDKVVATIAATRHQWVFSQGNGIFVHTRNASAMFWQARHSARYLKYYPSESIATFFSSFVQSLTNIEE